MRRVLGVVACAFGIPAFGASPAADCPKQFADKVVDPVTGREAPAARAAREELEMVVSVTAGYESCARDVPGFSEAFGPVYAEWRKRHLPAIMRYDQNPRARRYVQCGLEHEGRRIAAESAAGKAEKKRTCNELVGPGIGDIARRSYAR